MNAPGAVSRAAWVLGVQGRMLNVSASSRPGPQEFTILGLGEAGAREAMVRVRSSLEQSGVDTSDRSITVDLDSDPVRPRGAVFDLAIAVAVLAAWGRVPQESLRGAVLVGELSLTGELRPVRGVLPQLLAAKAVGLTQAIVPSANGPEAALAQGMRVFVAESLAQVMDHLRGVLELPRALPWPYAPEDASDCDLSDVKGQYAAKRALEVAAAGGHHLMFVSPPGGGATMLARRLRGILPPLTEAESIEATALHSVSGLLSPLSGRLTHRPFRAPHHTVSEAALVGGGDPLRPGEVSLAHLGVLFLDEAPEFRRASLESLACVLRDGSASFYRKQHYSEFPARPLVVASALPCPCGYAGDPSGKCRCPADAIRRQRLRIDGRFLSHIDIRITLPAVDLGELCGSGATETSEVVRGRVTSARQIQAHRTGALALLNGRIWSEHKFAKDMDIVAVSILSAAQANLHLSFEDRMRVLRVARTVADLEASDSIHTHHVAEALQLTEASHD